MDSGSTHTYLGPIFEPILEESIIPVTASVLLADNSVEQIVGEVNTLLSLAKVRKSLPVCIVHSLNYDFVSDKRDKPMVSGACAGLGRFRTVIARKSKLSRSGTSNDLVRSYPLPI